MNNEYPIFMQKNRPEERFFCCWPLALAIGVGFGYWRWLWPRAGKQL